MRISKALIAAALLPLAACVGTLDPGRVPPSKLALAESSVVIAGPPGYCIDRSATRVGENGGAFVLLGSCASIARNARAPKPRNPGVLTVTVSEGVTGDAAIAATLSDLGSWFRTEEGRAMLSRTGDPEDVEVLDVRVRDNTLFIHARDRAGREKGMDENYWRALFGVNDRLLTVSVAGFASRPMTQDTGLTTIDSLTRRIRAASTRGGAG